MTWVNGSDSVRLLLRDNKVIGAIYRDTRYANSTTAPAFWRANADRETLFVSEEAAKRAAERMA